jgi:Retrotransposon gag protein
MSSSSFSSSLLSAPQESGSADAAPSPQSALDALREHHTALLNERASITVEEASAIITRSQKTRKDELASKRASIEAELAETGAAIKRLSDIIRCDAPTELPLSSTPPSLQLSETSARLASLVPHKRSSVEAELAESEAAIKRLSVLLRCGAPSTSQSELHPAFAPPILEQPETPARLASLVPRNLPSFDPSVASSLKDPTDFIRSFTRTVSACGLDLDANWARLLPLCLSPGQADWLEANIPAATAWAEARMLFLDHYLHPARHHIKSAELWGITQARGESVRELCDRFMRLMRDAGIPDNNPILTDLLVSRLPIPVRNAIMVARTIGNGSVGNTVASVSSLAVALEIPST